jgi:hypothetical protein
MTKSLKVSKVYRKKRKLLNSSKKQKKLSIKKSKKKKRKKTKKTGVGPDNAPRNNNNTFRIPEGTTSLSGGSLERFGINKRTLVDVIIPDSVKSIGARAFSECINLEQINIPDSVVEIGSRAFSECRKLAVVIIPNSVNSIGNGAFQGCSALRNATIPESVDSINLLAFDRCHPELILEMETESMANKFTSINGLVRSVKKHITLPDDVGECITIQIWPASKSFITRTDRRGRPSRTYKGTIPDPPTLFDGSGIVQPLILQTLGGDQYLINGCWGRNPIAHPDFKRLVAEQHPEALGNSEEWSVLIDGMEESIPTLNLMEVGNMLVRGEFDLTKPVIVVWNEEEEEEN